MRELELEGVRVSRGEGEMVERTGEGYPEEDIVCR